MILFIIYWLFQSNLLVSKSSFEMWKPKPESYIVNGVCIQFVCTHLCRNATTALKKMILILRFFSPFLQSVHIIFTCIVSSQLHVNSIYRYDMWRHTLVNKNQQLLYNVNWVSCLFLLIWFVTDWLQKCFGLIYLIYRKAIFIHKKRWSTLTNVQTV